MDPFADIFQSPGDIPYDMELINDNDCFWKVFFCQITVNFVHIGNKVADLLFVRKSIQILHERDLRAGRKDVKQFMFFCIGKDSLKFLASGIAPELING